MTALRSRFLPSHVLLENKTDKTIRNSIDAKNMVGSNDAKETGQ